MAEPSAMGAEPKPHAQTPRSHPYGSRVQSNEIDYDMNRKLRTLDIVSADLMNLNKPAKKKSSNTRPKRARKDAYKINTNEATNALENLSFHPVQGPHVSSQRNEFNNQRQATSGLARRQKPGQHENLHQEGDADPTLVGNDSSAMSILTKFKFHQNMIERLKKRSQKHPLAEFMCKLCLYYCDTQAVVEKHISDKRHKEALQEHESNCTIKYMPEPVPAQLECLTLLVESKAKTNGLTYNDRRERQKIADHINSLVEKNLPGCSVRLYGSSLNCLGLKTSDVNIDFVVPNDQSPSKLLLALNDLILAGGRFESVECDLNADLPGIHFKEKASMLACLICLNNKNAYEISKLLAHYESIDGRVKTLAAVFRLWASLCKLDQVALGCWPSYAFDLMLVYYLQQTATPVLPVLHDLIDNPNATSPDHYLDPANLGDKWKGQNNMSTGELWLNLFRFYTRDFTITERVVCIRQLAPLKRSTKKWPGRKMAIEDPFTPKRNVSRSIVNIKTFDYILYCFQCTYKYYANLQTKSGPIFGTIQMPCMDQELEQVFNQSHHNMDVEKILKSDPLYSSRPHQGDCKNYKDLTILPKNVVLLFSHFNTQNLCYKFNSIAFTNGEVLPVVCCICQQEGHVKDTCKAEKLPPLEDLPPMTETFLNHISCLCEETFEALLPSDEEIKQRERIVFAIQEYLTTFNPMAKLELFGSSCNGFGLHKSDLDICLTFKDNKSGEVRNYSQVIEDLVTKLRKYEQLGNVIAITTAKVPIVKFTHLESKLDGDISVYNTLAQRNTKMLRVYSEIDPRVKILGFMFKRFAKLCDICDASRGSLSSYAYTLMVIYFLQRCEPPLVPVLQQLYPTNEPANKEPVLVEGCNTYFFEDVEEVPNVWPGYKKNTLSVGKLWLQLLQYYTEKFEFKIDVIAIRQLETLHRFEKLWNSKSIAIEDPFDLTHNLGAGLSRKMHLFIVNAFRRGRLLFGTPVELRVTGTSLQAYFFDPTRLVDGIPPRDRCCKFCNKIGHVVKECPLKKQDIKNKNDSAKLDPFYRRLVRDREEIGKLEKDFYKRTPNREQYENGHFNQSGARGMNRNQQSTGGFNKDHLTSSERLLNAVSHSPSKQYGGPNQRGYARESRGAQYVQYHSQSSSPAYGRQGSPREISIQHHSNVSCAPNWKPSVDVPQIPRSFSNYPNFSSPQEPYMPRNLQNYHFNQDGPRRQPTRSTPSPNSHVQGSSSAYTREEAQAIRSSPPRGTYESHRYRYSPSRPFLPGRLDVRPEQFYVPGQNSGGYK